jgi:type III restriction enzyme
MEGVLRFQASNLVLKVSNSYDPHKLDLSVWDDYLDVLCGDRLYQKEAIKTAVIYLASGEYTSINQLVHENYKTNPDLQEKYKVEAEYIKTIQLPQKLSGVLDLATGTGKSFVIYGIAQIMLSLQTVKRVLVLCPSTTIERELQKKFNTLASDIRLKANIPSTALFKNPHIIDANDTIEDGDICIENIHAVYENTGSSIASSFAAGGEDTLVLNDEIHHAYNSSNDKDIKKWKEFLLGNYNFRYMLGFTGTAYIDNEYFSDVIYRFSLRQAIDHGFVKLVEYVSKDESISQNEKFQKIYDNHREFKKKYSDIKPLTIVASKDIKSAENLLDNFADFLSATEGITRETALEKSLVVTSAQKHKKNIAILQTVDSQTNPVEWIFSVSMLTEGWDVKNVFQIVPWEDRAFNSKLLIAQILGRGLRIPDGFSVQPKVRVFNHASWSKNIQLLVDEILETELTLTSHILESGDRSEYHFSLYTIDYTKEERAIERVKKEQEVFDLTKGIKLVSQIESEKKETEYEDTRGNLQTKTTIIQKETTSVNEIINKIVESFKGRALEAKLVFPSGEYEQERLPSIKDIKDYIESSMRDCGIEGDQLTIENANKIYGKFTGLLRRKPATPVFSKKVDSTIEIRTLEMHNETARYSVIKRDMTLFLSDTYRNEMTADEIEAYEAVKEDMKTKQIKEISKYYLKTPMNIVFTTLEPEKRFVELLTGKDLSGCIDAWIKSRDMGFYSIDYQKNKGSKFQSFNPDFFIKVGNNIIVVETKVDNDNSDENRAKYRAAKRHFELLNNELANKNIPQRYYFCFLSPVDYKTFEQYVLDGRMFTYNFRSKLEDLLEKSEDD